MKHMLNKAIEFMDIDNFEVVMNFEEDIIFLLDEVEKQILLQFADATTIDNAKETIKNAFDDFIEKEFDDFISSLIIERIIVPYE